MGELSRWEDLLKTGSEDTVKPLSRVEAILRDEDITPQSRIEKLLKEGGGGGGSVLYDEYEVTQNKTKIVPPDGYDGFSSIITNIPDPTLITKNVTTNGTFNAEDDNADGYSSFNVNVPQLFSKVELYQVEYDALTPAEKTDPSKFYVIKPGSPPIYVWDFTKAIDPLVDEKQGAIITNNGCTFEENGIKINDKNQYMTMPVYFKKGFTYEIDVYEGTPENVQRGFISFTNGNAIINFYNRYPDDDTQPRRWGVWDGRFHYGINLYTENDINLRNNTIKIVHNGTVIDIYKDETLILHADSLNEGSVSANPYFCIGKQNDSYNTLTVKAIRIYENEEV